MNAEEWLREQMRINPELNSRFGTWPMGMYLEMCRIADLYADYRITMAWKEEDELKP